MKNFLKGTSALALATGLFLSFAGTASAASFINGDFETGDFTGWTKGGGTWGNSGQPNPFPCGTGTGGGCLTGNQGGSAGNITPDTFSGGSPYNTGGVAPSAFQITNVGFDSVVGGTLLPTVYAGQHSAKINDSVNNYSASTIVQSVAHYTDSHVFFAWAAVLEGSHTATDSDEFALLLRDTTTGSVLYSVTYSSAEAGASALFHTSGVVHYTDWQVESLDLSTTSFASGDGLQMELLGLDCPYGGHYGYVYLDGFGAVTPPSTVPEPATLGILGLGVTALAGLARRRRAA